MTEAEREHWDHVAGSMSEQQNAYALSCMELPPDDSQKIKDLVKAGRFVLVQFGTAYCTFTDAIIGRRNHYIGDYASYAEAKNAGEQQPGWFEETDGECGYYIDQPPSPQVAIDTNDGSIPF